MSSSSLPLRHLRRLSTNSSLSFSQAKSKLRTEYDPDKALKIYSSVSKSSSSSPRYAQDLAVRRLAKSRRFSDIESLLESHKSHPHISQEPFLSSLIRSYGRSGMFSHALNTYHQMDKFGTPRSSLSFNALLSACTQSKLFDQVPELFSEIPAKYLISPDKISYGILIKSYCEAGKPEKAIEVLSEMESKEIEVTAVTFTTILGCLYKLGKIEEAERIWDLMIEKGCEIDVAAYNVKLMHAQGGEPGRLRKLIEEMEDFGLKPDTISYNYLMTCYCRNGMVEDAVKVYEGLEGNGCRANAATFRTLVYYLCRSGEVEMGFEVFKRSVVVNKIPDFNTMKHLAVGLVEKKKLGEAKELIRTVKMKFPAGFLNAWKKVEGNLGLGPLGSDNVNANANANTAVEDDYEEDRQATA